jgi:hypothetical protein
MYDNSQVHSLPLICLLLLAFHKIQSRLSPWKVTLALLKEEPIFESDTVRGHRSEEDLLACEETMLSSNMTHHTPQANGVRTQLSFSHSPSSTPWEFNNTPHYGASEGANGDGADHRRGVISPLGGFATVGASTLAIQHPSMGQQQYQQSNVREANSSSPGQKQSLLNDVWRPRTVSPPGSANNTAAAVVQMTQTLRQTTLSEIWRPMPTHGGSGSRTPSPQNQAVSDDTDESKVTVGRSGGAASCSHDQLQAHSAESVPAEDSRESGHGSDGGRALLAGLEASASFDRCSNDDVGARGDCTRQEQEDQETGKEKASCQARGGRRSVKRRAISLDDETNDEAGERRAKLALQR